MRRKVRITAVVVADSQSLAAALEQEIRSHLGAVHALIAMTQTDIYTRLSIAKRVELSIPLRTLRSSQRSKRR